MKYLLDLSLIFEDLSLLGRSRSAFSGLAVDRDQHMLRLWKFRPQCPKESPQLELANFMPPYPPYIALSYMWGETATGAAKQIRVIGRKLRITKNLQDFIMILHSNGAHTEQWFWADQIAIDQSNVRERNHQVSCMGDIYTQATMVFAWLGMATGLSSFDPEALSRALPVETEAIANSALTLLHVSEHDYWQRLWIVQELRLARRVLVWCRNCMIESKALLSNLGLLASDIRWFELRHDRSVGRRLRSFDSNARCRIKSLLYYNQDSQQIRTILFSILQEYGKSQCSDPRDKIFGLQSMVDHSQRLEIDYSLSLEQVVLKALRIIIMQHDFSSAYHNGPFGRPIHFWSCSSYLGFLPVYPIRDVILEKTKLLYWGYQVPRYISRTCSSHQSYTATTICKHWMKTWRLIQAYSATSKQALLLSDILDQLQKLAEPTLPATAVSTTGKPSSSLSFLLAKTRFIFLDTILAHGFSLFGGYLSHPDDWLFSNETPSRVSEIEKLVHLQESQVRDTVVDFDAAST